MQTTTNHKKGGELCKPWGVGRGRVATGWLSSHGLIEVVHNLRIISGGDDDEVGGTTLRKKSHTERFLPNNRADLKPKLNTYRSTVTIEFCVVDTYIDYTYINQTLDRQPTCMRLKTRPISPHMSCAQETRSLSDLWWCLMILLIASLSMVCTSASSSWSTPAE